MRFVNIEIGKYMKIVEKAKKLEAIKTWHLAYGYKDTRWYELDKILGASEFKEKE